MFFLQRPRQLAPRLTIGSKKKQKTLTSLSPWSSRWLITGYWSVSHLNSFGMPILSPPAPAPPLLASLLLRRPECCCRPSVAATQGDPAKEDRREETPTTRLPPNPMLLPPTLLLLGGMAPPGTKNAEAGVGAVEEHSNPTASVSTRPARLLAPRAFRLELESCNAAQQAWSYLPWPSA